MLITFRKAVVSDANLLLRPEKNMSAAKELIESIREELKNIEEIFQITPADMAQDNINGTTVQDEFIKLYDEFWGLLRYCKNKIANQPAPGAAAGADQVRLSRLNFPTFDGKDNFRNWKTEFDTLIALVLQEEVKRSRLLEALTGDAKIYIKSVITPEKNYNDIVALLQARYDDPLVIVK